MMQGCIIVALVFKETDLNRQLCERIFGSISVPLQSIWPLVRVFRTSKTY